MVERVREECPPLPASVEEALAQGRQIVLVTGHRRENVGEPLREICAALLRLSQLFPETRFVFPVHLNPRVRETVQSVLGGARGVLLIPPLPYKPFVRLMDACCLILTDSGGIQEEGPSLGKPVLIMRDITERPEGLEAGVNILVGTRSEKIVTEASRRLRAETNATAAPGANPYGDGQAARRIADFLLGRFVAPMSEPVGKLRRALRCGLRSGFAYAAARLAEETANALHGLAATQTGGRFPKSLFARGKEIVILAGIQWRFRFQRPQQLAQALVRAGMPGVLHCPRRRGLRPFRLASSIRLLAAAAPRMSVQRRLRRASRPVGKREAGGGRGAFPALPACPDAGWRPSRRRHCSASFMGQGRSASGRSRDHL